MTCTRSVYRQQSGPCSCYCYCHRWRLGQRLRLGHRQCSRARPRGARCIITLGGRRPRIPRWHRRDDQSRRRAIWGLFLHALVKSTSWRGKKNGASGREPRKGREGGVVCLPLYVLLLWACCIVMICRAALVGEGQNLSGLDD